MANASDKTAYYRIGIDGNVRQFSEEASTSMKELAEKIANATVGRLVLDGDVILPADGSTINERRKLAINGQISIAVAIGRDGRPLGRPQVRVQGVPVEEDRAAFIEDAAELEAFSKLVGLIEPQLYTPLA